MVTFRFYLVSIVAFFLALAVGVVIGSVLDQGISTSLKDRLEGVEANLNDTVASIDDKNREIDALQQYAEASAPFAVQNTLTGTSALVVAEPGLDGAPVEDLVLRLRQSGARVSGIVWLDQRWDLTEAEDRSGFEKIVDGAGLSVEQLHRAAWQGLLDASPGTGEGGTATTSSTVPATTAPEGTETTTTLAPQSGEPVAAFEDAVLMQLADAGFLRLVSLDGDNPVGGAQLVVVSVTGTESALSTPGSAAVELADQAATLTVPTVLSEIYSDGGTSSENPPDRGTIVRAASGASEVKFSTVDDLDLIAGRVASVLALSDLKGGGTVGRFGYGPDVDGILPRWPGP